MLALHEDAQEAETEEEKAERERERADHSPPWVESRAVRADHAHAQHRHAERPAAGRPGVPEVENLQSREDDGDGDIGPGPVHRMARHDLPHQVGGRESQREQPRTDRGIDEEGQEPGHRARVVPLRGHPVRGATAAAHPGTWPAPGATGPVFLRRVARCTQRSMNWSIPTAWLRAESSASLATPPDERAITAPRSVCSTSPSMSRRCTRSFTSTRAISASRSTRLIRSFTST